jgi:hypothetical protein
VPPSEHEADVSVVIEAACSPEAAWQLIADPACISRWSPESTQVKADCAAPLPVGARFRGLNRHGLFRWSTTSRVVESTEGSAFAFDVTFLGTPVARWRYAITPIAGGCRIEEQWWEHRGRMLKVAGIVGTGVADRAKHNRRTMEATLRAMKSELEAA